MIPESEKDAGKGREKKFLVHGSRLLMKELKKTKNY